ncbi:MAG TPA: ATP-binding cassette domain-containing protein [Rhodobacteraceae bacterium]|nr:ATP-binding cassette domain-containing protein [Paracoccaceae bacterium]
MTKPAKLSCKALWKVYGDGRAIGHVFGAEIFPPGDDVLENQGLIGAVRHAFLDIAEGEIFVIMGLSGSGKSTLVRLLAGLIKPSFGEISLDGQDLLKMSERELIELRRHKMGMVFQHFALLPHLTVAQNVAFPLSIQGMKPDAARARAEEVIRLVGLEGREGNYPRELSGGQQQRVGIARSLAVEPEIWFLDEPFSALDPLIRREMQDEFLRLQGMLKKTIVFITHDFDEAIRLADRIAIMKDGHIIQVATPEQLVLNPADTYVEEFTRHVPRDKVLSVGAIMRPGAEGRWPGVEAGARVAEVAEAVIDAGEPLMVVENGQPVGAIDAEAVIRVLVGKR